MLIHLKFITNALQNIIAPINRDTNLEYYYFPPILVSSCYNSIPCQIIVLLKINERNEVCLHVWRVTVCQTTGAWRQTQTLRIPPTISQ